jgi:hypothetical protein
MTFELDNVADAQLAAAAGTFDRGRLGNVVQAVVALDEYVALVP